MPPPLLVSDARFLCASCCFIQPADSCVGCTSRVFGGDRIKNLMVAFRVEDLPMESQMLTDALDTAQKRVESYFYDIRK